MLSLEPLSGGQESYYLREVADGAEEYYSQGGEVPGRWLGTLAGRLGLAGEVAGDDLRAVLSGVVPATGERIARCNRRVAAIDVTLSAPKSVSLLWALGGAEVAGWVVAAHEQAVEAALGYLEREAVRARRGRAGAEVVDGSGLIAAAFRHRTSRLGDPQLHTHVLVANATLCPDDGVWRALHGKVLFWHARAAGHLYQAELRRELARTLGVRWTPTVKGCAEIEGVPVAALAEFSQRRAQIEAAMARDGDRSPRASRRAAVATRPAKEHDVDQASLRAEWAGRAGLHGLDSQSLADLLRPQRLSVREPARASARPSVQTAVQVAGPSVGPCEVEDEVLAAELSERDSVFDRRHVIMAVSNRVPATVGAAQVEERADRFLASRQVVAVGVAHTGVQYSTVELIEWERRLVADARGRRHDGAGVCRRAAEGLEAFGALSNEQRRMVSAITTDGQGVSVVVGAAGSGKTYALAAARTLWEAEGYTVIGCSLAARAAAQLHEGAGIPSCSLDRLLGAVDRQRLRLWPDTVVVVDEAAMVGTRKLARLLAHAERAGAKVVLAGDHHQLPEIEAGGAFAALARHLDGTHLRQNRRQQDRLERAALVELRTGDPARALGLLDLNGRVHEHRSSDEARRQMVADWLDTVAEGDDALMLAVTRADVDDLNRRARQALRTEGAFDGPDVSIGERPYAVGDCVITTRNDYRLGVLNGQRGFVTDVDGRRGTLIVAFENAPPAIIPADYLEAGGVEHAYAITIHKAQGLTCDHAFLLAEEHLYREAAYTALSRGRHANHLYTATDTDPESHLPQHDHDPLDGVRDALARSRSQTLASINLLDLPPAPDRTVATPNADLARDPDLGIDIGP